MGFVGFGSVGFGSVDGVVGRSVGVVGASEEDSAACVASVVSGFVTVPDVLGVSVPGVVAACSVPASVAIVETVTRSVVRSAPAAPVPAAGVFFAFRQPASPRSINAASRPNKTLVFVFRFMSLFPPVHRKRVRSIGHAPEKRTAHIAARQVRHSVRDAKTERAFLP